MTMSTITTSEFIQAATRGRCLDLLISNLSDDAVAEFDQANDSLGGAVEHYKYNPGDWMTPKKYQNFDLLPWLIQQCKNDVETARVELEWQLYTTKGLVPVLQTVKYLVDIMREHNLVWGVGRGSSVASYVLYLIGVHKINSIEYNLDFSEFMR